MLLGGGVDYFLWLPTKDHNPPKKHQLLLGIRQIDYLVKNKIKTYMHCKNGHGRAPTMLATYFVSQGLTVKQAVAKIRKKRPEIHIETSQLKALNKLKLLKIKL
ncbi:MAG: hypothetical protein CMI53_00845 [Parcubacteria group bacterium]|nr:hypothetical protein [Parcubacteria group bacterium]